MYLTEMISRDIDNVALSLRDCFIYSLYLYVFPLFSI